MELTVLWQRTASVLRICLWIACITPGSLCSMASAQSGRSKKNSDTVGVGKIGSGSRNVQKKTCLVPVKIRGMNEGELAEVLDRGQNRVAIVRLVRVNRNSSRLMAQVLVGEENCSSLSGYAIRPLSSSSAASALASGTQISEVASLSGAFIVHQLSLPGLALNKFLSPGYTQRGFGLRASAAFPRQPMRFGKFNLQGSAGVVFSSSATSPALDIVKEGKVIGTQNFATTAYQFRGGARALTSDARLWTEVGLVLLDSLASKSTLAKAGTNVDALFPAVRELNGQGFGLYAEQGLVVGQNARLSLSGALGLGTKYKTPVLEDGEATNTSENFKTEGLPIFAGINLNVPVWRGAYAELNFDYANVKLSLPLVNDQLSKSQIEKLSFSLGAGYRF